MSGPISTGTKRKKDNASSSDEDIWEDFDYFIVKGKKIAKDSSAGFSGFKSSTSVFKKTKASDETAQLNLLSSRPSSSSRVIATINDDDSSMDSFESENESGVGSPLIIEETELDRLRRLNDELKKENDELKSQQDGSRLMTANDKRRKVTGRKTRHTTIGALFDPNNKEYLEMIKALEEAGDDDGTWCCPSCNKVYKDKWTAVFHIQDLHFGRQHPCSKCPAILADRSSLRTHVSRVHSAFKYTKPLPNLAKVLVFEGGQVTSRKFEPKDRDNLFDHWLCEYKCNPLTGEPSPHKFSSGYHWLSDVYPLRQTVYHANWLSNTNKPNKQKEKNGCENIKKMLALNFHLDLDTVRSSRIYSIGESTAVKVKPCVRDAVYATYSRNHLDGLQLLDDAAKAHFHATLKSAQKEGDEQLKIWKKWAVENVNVLVNEVLSHSLWIEGVSVSKIMDFLSKSRLVTFWKIKFKSTSNWKSRKIILLLLKDQLICSTV